LVHALWLWRETQVNAVQAGALLMLFFAWNGSKTFKELEVKRSVMMHRIKATQQLLY